MDWLTCWKQIQDGDVEYERPSEGITADVYLKDEYVFKSGGERVWRNKRLNEAAAAVGVRAPSVVGSSREEGVVAYERIDGTLLANADEDEAVQFASAAGEQLAAMHQASYDGFGSFQSMSPSLVGEYDTYEAFVEGRLSDAMGMPATSAFRPYVERCRNVIEAAEIPEYDGGSLMHGDFHGANMIVDDGEVSVIDFENGYLGSPAMDAVHAYLMLKTNHGDAFAEAFLDEYGTDIAAMAEVDVCMGVLTEAMALRWWEANRDEPMTERLATLNQFVAAVL